MKQKERFRKIGGVFLCDLKINMGFTEKSGIIRNDNVSLLSIEHFKIKND